jgi:hypothetical protein
MSAFIVSVAFLLAGGQPPADAPAATTAAPAAQTPAKEPKMICKYEQAVGSRLQKTKVCRPEGQSSEDQDTKLQRELSKNGDFVEPQRGFGN